MLLVFLLLLVSVLFLHL